MAKEEDPKPKKTAASAAAKGAPKSKAYDASSISVLEGLEPVRKRPGMYIGTTGPDGLHHLIWEIFDNSRDEAMGGFADDIEVALLPGGYVRVIDESGEDYLYPADFFVAVDRPREAERALASTLR